jgi:hypothetical protein
MAGLDQAIHDSSQPMNIDVDVRHKAGGDECSEPYRTTAAV